MKDVKISMTFIMLIFLVGSANGGGVLYTGSDVEEFDQPNDNTSDRIGKFATDGPIMVGGGIIVTPEHVNGMTVVGNQLITGTVGTPSTTAADGQTLRTRNLAGVQQSSVVADLLTTQFNEDLGYDGTFVWHAHFTDEDNGQIRKLDPNNLGGPALAVFNLDFGVVGMTFAAGDLWITDWAGQQVGTWAPNVFTPVFSTAGLGDAGGLAFDPIDSVLWVGTSGGQVTPFSLAGVQLGPSFQPFGPIGDTVDGLAFSTGCGAFPCGNNNNKVFLCHVPPGNPGNKHTICISPNAVDAHLGNHPGDHCGPCGDDDDDDDDDGQAPIRLAIPVVGR